MRILWDTNVILDVLLKREPWYPDAAKLWQAVDEKHIIGYMTASVATDIYYIARKVGGVERARLAVRLCLSAFQICTVDRQTLELAETMQMGDFEDNVQIACAHLTGINAIVTRDVDGFVTSLLPTYTPNALVKLLYPQIFD